jgi:dienelactone hydrolase
MPGVSIGVGGDADIGIGTSSDRYGIENTWESPGLQDVYFVNLETGERELFMERVQGVNLSLSPNGKYFTWFDRVKQTWFVKDRETEKVLDLKDAIPTALHDETHDSPSLAGAYGSPGWTDDDAAFLVYDSHDIWAVDPKGFWPARTITEGVGRRDDIQFRMSGGRGGRGGRGGGPRRTIDPTEPVLLSARHEATKDQGYYRDRVQGDSRPEKLIMAPKSFSTPNKADDADVQLFTRSSFDEFADLWVSDTNFRSMRKMTDANPQQKEFTWGTAELVKWTSSNGDPLQGILYKPEGFDAAKKYPMMVYFYETNANSLHRYVTPSAGGSSINYAFYVSRGYLLFVPDIIYRIGYPGQSAMHCVMPGIGSLIDKGFVDEKRIGVQGHSWGGYQIAYMVTQTDIFAAAEAGAPVSNMFSAYGGIRWASGVNRAFQYERTQSRIGGSIWDYPLRFLENSPIFYADKVDTPLLMLHNDEDGAVPWYQGIEYYIALRRNGRPVWMLNYNGEAHGLRQAKNQRDWTIRMQQFFDHYLKDEPAPVWLAEGVPATMKGRTLGLEPAENKDKNGGPGGERE